MDWFKKIIKRENVKPGAEDEVSYDEIQEQPDLPEVEHDTEPSADAVASVIIGNAGLTASVIISPPDTGGEEITIAKIRDALSKAGVIFGIDDGAVEEVAGAKNYGHPHIVARGIEPKDGLDGQVIDMFERERGLSLVEDEQGTVDFKQLNLIQDIPEKTVICEITLPTQPEPGKDVLGRDLLGRAGITPTIPMGENTTLINNDTKLIASKGGNLIFSNNRFSVQTTVDISGNVDNSTGNITFSNDVIVRGSVLEGYSINAGGSVTVYGIVEGASITAGKDVTLKHGINGMGKAIIDAKGNVTSAHIENCTIKAGGKVTSESIIHSTVYSGDCIDVTSGRGCIIGGTCSALNKIDVKTIGNTKSTPANIILGATQEMIAERRQLVDEIRTLETNQNNYTLDIHYLEQLSTRKELTQKQQSQLKDRRMENIRALMNLSNLSKRAEELEKLIAGNENCKITFTKIYPPIRIMIGNDNKLVHQEHNRGVVYYADGEIKFSL